ncbi:phosphatase PAP2 family protein [Actinoplanes missouriensis]|uniref:phosphatase PAP2 family protein n=1 Tax=Actinoplanes missouriensis TaxID=1866 RepID=UPI0033C1E3FA
MTMLSPGGTRRGGRPSAVVHLLGPLVISVLAGLSALVTYHVFVRTISGQTLDTAAMLGTDVQHPRLAGLLSNALDATNMRSVAVVCVIVAAIGGLRRRIDLAVAAAVLVLGANVTTQLLKNRLPRPPFDGLQWENSLPSGHTTAAAAMAFALVLVLPEAVRGTAALAGAGFTGAIAISTVWARWHRPSDTVAAILVVLAWGALVVFCIRLLRWTRQAAPGRPSWLATLPLLVTAALAVPVTVVGLLFAKTSATVATEPEPSRLSFLTGIAGIAAAVSLAFLTWLWLATADRDRPTESSSSRAIPPAHEPGSPGR